MGYIRHNAMVVTDCDSAVEKIHATALEIMGQFEHLVTPLINSKMNGTATFFVAPDGSKEGWTTSNEADVCRERLVDYLRTTHADWCEIRYGGDESEGCVLIANDTAAIGRSAWSEDRPKDIETVKLLPKLEDKT